MNADLADGALQLASRDGPGRRGNGRDLGLIARRRIDRSWVSLKCGRISEYFLPPFSYGMRSPAHE
jgi:hypothetical protein